MTDRMAFEAPLGRVVLSRHLRRLLEERAAHVRRLAETQISGGR